MLTRSWYVNKDTPQFDRYLFLLAQSCMHVFVRLIDAFIRSTSTTC